MVAVSFNKVLLPPDEFDDLESTVPTLLLAVKVLSLIASKNLLFPLEELYLAVADVLSLTINMTFFAIYSC